MSYLAEILEINEWFILTVSIAGFFVITLFPRKFTRPQRLTMFLIGFYFVTLFDQTLAKPPFNYYDVNDSGSFTIWDLLSYFMYTPFTYIYLSGLTVIRKTRLGVFAYVIGWAVFSILSEGAAWLAGVYHYNKGYTLLQSFPVYLFVLSLTLLYYHYFVNQIAKSRSSFRQRSN
ncbi:hypothetical protein [Sporolactobacillus vineae]|uniref:hypothetical protein n=1 Tax=Sporolactobacillus vineae TaxID=444463 RepID=UPI00028894FE|nr:hypothetical protein [Sporolactobacillus vineae]